MPADRTATADLEHLYALNQEARSLLFTGARTAYRFSDEPVGDDQLRAIWELAKWPPTANNVNPMRILYLRTPEAKQRLLPLLAPPNRAKSSSAPVVAVLALDSEFDEYVPQLSPATPGMREALAAAPAMRDAMASFNSAIQAAYFLLAVRATGLAAGPMKGFDAPAVDREFFADGRWRSILVVNIGKPADAEATERLPRPEYDQVVRLL
ncbi:malonic semialdehyde reductase [Actinoplanes teichomyceticus]|uniref:3-hydroxypropanoate dehydrogenase n=1 Tax=Actinoplanes teichomyceticus TaxID=1867 RepID=A0A561WBF8_ACTTI|nr:malonic semialdehyde reductase [Actinoplanes teichomyceticus]TWG21198.1 3-hydroxypropanoate dehydrogenase [Actinoplanes teichomyceticus]GIF15019.1 putative NADH dehydrogenase/NAD(P)H nitroreductase [Actinoplanes teichomyceticus]